MAQEMIDTTGQERLDTTMAKIQANFTELYAADVTTSATTFQLDTGTKTATASAGAATLNKSSGIITTEALTTAAGANYTLVLTNSTIAAGDIPIVQVDSNGSTGLPVLVSAKCTANTLTVIINNAHATVALNKALKIAYAILKA